MTSTPILLSLACIYRTLVHLLYDQFSSLALFSRASSPQIYSRDILQGYGPMGGYVAMKPMIYSGAMGGYNGFLTTVHYHATHIFFKKKIIFCILQHIQGYIMYINGSRDYPDCSMSLIPAPAHTSTRCRTPPPTQTATHSTQMAQTTTSTRHNCV